MKKYTLLCIVIFVLVSLPATGLAQNNIQVYKNIRYEYSEQNSTNKKEGTLVICVPGFTQHNNSREFEMIKQFFRNSQFSFLIMNPPQHGEDYTCFAKLYSWGEKEIDDLLELTKHLQVWDRYKEIHLFGFSIGAKIALKFSAESENKDAIKSVIAIAAPFRVGDINMRLSGDIKKISEGLQSSFNAIKRTSMLRAPYMVLAGMTKALCINQASPANEMASIKAPTLLLHGSDDWLTKSYHSVQLFERTPDTAKTSIVIFNTATHAEDMLSRDGLDLKNAFFETLKGWFDYIKSPKFPDTKTDFDKVFKTKLKTKPLIQTSLYNHNKISLMSSPTFNEFNTNIWNSAADLNHSFITFNSSLKLNDGSAVKHFLTLRPTPKDWFLLQQTRLGLSFTQNDSDNNDTLEGYFSFYQPFGSIMWLRRLTFIQGLNNSSRQIYSADIAFLVMDFQLNYGKFIGNKNDWQLGFNCPLVSSASGNYYIGVGYSTFLSSTNLPNKNNFRVYSVIGPSYPIFQTRIRLNFQYEQNGFFPDKVHRALSVGLSFNFHEM